MAFGTPSSSVLREVSIVGALAPAPESGIVPVSDETRKARLERLVAEHHALVWRSARRLGVPAADLDDVVQEVFLTASRNLDSIDHERGYLLKTCIFVAAHARRTIQRRREVSDDERLDREVDRAARPDEHAEMTEARLRLQGILDKMPEELRAIFILFELERFTMAEIAELMSLPSGTVASRLRRARELFMTLASRSERNRGVR